MQKTQDAVLRFEEVYKDFTALITQSVYIIKTEFCK